MMIFGPPKFRMSDTPTSMRTAECMSDCPASHDDGEGFRKAYEPHRMPDSGSVRSVFRVCGRIAGPEIKARTTSPPRESY